MKLIINVNNMTERDWHNIKAIIETQFTSLKDTKSGIFNDGTIDYIITANEKSVKQINIIRK